MEQPGSLTAESNSDDAPSVSLPAGDEPGYESRTSIVERLTDGTVPPSNMGWARRPILEGQMVCWQRVLRECPHSQIVETLILHQAEPAPTGAGWRLPEPESTWSQRSLWGHQGVKANNGTASTSWGSGGESPSLSLQAGESKSYGHTSSEDTYGYHPEYPGYSPGTRVLHPVTGNSLRAWVTLALTCAIIVVVLAGVIMRVPIESFTTYIAPLSALAGTALGFWFGSETHSR